MPEPRFLSTKYTKLTKQTKYTKQTRRTRKAEGFELREAQSPYKAFFEYRGVSLARSPIPDSVVQSQVAPLSSYNGLFGVENDDIGSNNTYFCNFNGV